MNLPLKFNLQRPALFIFVQHIDKILHPAFRQVQYGDGAEHAGLSRNLDALAQMLEKRKIIESMTLE